MPRDLFAERGINPSRDLLAERGIQPPNNPSNDISGLEQFYRASGIHGANRGFAKIFGFGPHQQNTEEAFQQASETHPIASNVGNIAAQLYSSIPFAMATGAAPGAGALRNIGGAAAGGALTGAVETPYDNETRLSNILQNALSSAALPAIGYGLKGGYQGAKALKEAGIPKMFSKEKIAKGIQETYSGGKAKHGPLYETLFKDAKELGAKTNLGSKVKDKGSLNKIIDKKLDGVDKAARKAVKKAFTTDDPAKVKEARSALQGYIQSQKRIKAAGNNYNVDAYKSANKMYKDLGKELNKSLEKVGLDKRYADINKSFKKEVVSYEKIPALFELESGNLTAKDFVKALQSDTKSGKRFRSHLAEAHPEVKHNQFANWAKNAGAGAVGLKTANEIWDALFK